jgi:hypothetical protein
MWMPRSGCRLAEISLRYEPAKVSLLSSARKINPLVARENTQDGPAVRFKI